MWLFVDMNIKNKILEIISNKSGEWVNVDEITAQLKLNRTIITTTVNAMMKSKSYNNIERSIKDKTVGTGSMQRREYTIKYRLRGSNDNNQRAGD